MTEEIVPFACRLCREHGGKCAFVTTVFLSDNHDCATMRTLRALGDDMFYRYPPGTKRCSEDQTLVVIPLEGKFIILGWYKERGRVELAQVVDEERIAPLDIDTAEECIEFYKKQNLELL